MPSGEKRHREGEQVVEQPGGQLQVEGRANIERDPRAQCRDAHPNDRQQYEAQREQRQQVAIPRHHDLIDRELHHQRSDDRKYLDRGAEQQELGQATANTRHATHQLAQPDPSCLFFALEVLRGRELEGDAGEVLRHLVERHRRTATDRIVDDHRAPVHLGHHHEVVQIPMEDRRQAELAEQVQIQPQWASGQVEALGKLDQVGERRALQRNRVLSSQGDEVGLVSEVAGDHGKARQAALGRLGLEHERRSFATGEGEEFHPDPSHSDFPEHAVERLEHPLVETAPIEPDVGVDQHPGLQTEVLPVRFHELLIEPNGDPIGRFLQRDG